MSIRRKARPDSNFYILDKRISEDTRLSWAARGLLVFLLGKPDHWEVSVNHLVKQTEVSAKSSGRDAVRSLINELIKSGYVIRQERRGEKGIFKGYDYLVSEIPEPLTPSDEQPETDYPAPDEAASPNPPQVSIEDQANTDTQTPLSDESDKELSETEIADAMGDDPEPETNDEPDPDWQAFEIFWFAGLSKKGGKQEAFKKFMTVVRDAQKKNKGMTSARVAGYLRRDIEKRKAVDQYGLARLHATTYLNKRRWTDEISESVIEQRTETKRLDPLEQFEQAKRERDAQRQSGLDLAENGRDIRGHLDQGAGQGAIRPLDSGSADPWET